MAKQTKGQIGVTTENIFPVIKQFLYSDHAKDGDHVQYTFKAKETAQIEVIF